MSVGLYFVALDARTQRGMGDWIQHAESLAGLIAVAESSKGTDRPRSSMRVLPAVFTDARHITFNIAWVVLRVFKWRSEDENQSLGPAHQLLIHSAHGPLRPTRPSIPAHNSP